MPTNLPAASDGDSRDPVDRELLLRIAADRDKAAMEALYVRFKPRLTPFLRRLSADDTLIEEAFNDVMLKVWDKAHQYQARSKASSWIFSIAYRVALRMAKKQHRRNDHIELHGDDLPDAAVDTSQEDDINATLVAAVKALPAKHRIVVELCYFEGYSLQEIAAIARCPVNTIKTRLHNARKKLRGLLEEVASPTVTNGAR